MTTPHIPGEPFAWQVSERQETWLRAQLASLARGDGSYMHTIGPIVAWLAFEGLESLRGLVECECLSVADPDDASAPGWFDTRYAALCETVADAERGGVPTGSEVAHAVALLERAGEIERHPSHPHLIRLREV